MIWRHVPSDALVILNTGAALPPGLPQVYLLPRILTPGCIDILDNSSFPHHCVLYEENLQRCSEDARTDNNMQVHMF